MNDTTLMQLKILVERTVRPVCASTSHKRKMREEMLAHVTTVFEEEHTKLCSECAALERTEQRFGKSAELAAQLQQSVPRLDWLVRLYENRFPRPNESPLRFALRFASAYALLTAPVFLLFSLILPMSWMFGVGFVLGELAASFVGAFIVGLFGRAAWLALYGPGGPSWRRIALVTASAGLLGVGILFLYAALRWNEDGYKTPLYVYWSDSMPALPALVVGGPFLLIFACYVARQGLYGSADRSWWKAAFEYIGWCLAAAMLTIGLSVPLSGSLSPSMVELMPSVLAAEWVIPIDLLLRISGAYRKLRSDREWANLPTGSQNGAAI